jgi:hypothetical protein
VSRLRWVGLSTLAVAVVAAGVEALAAAWRVAAFSLTGAVPRGRRRAAATLPAG